MPISNNYAPIHNYTCEVWQSNQNSITTTDHDDDDDDDHIDHMIRRTTRSSSTCQQHSELFLIDVFVAYDVVLDDQGLSMITSSSPRPSCHSQFMAQKHLLLNNATSWSMISNMLSHVLVPLHNQPFIIHKISAAARAIAGRPGNAAAATIRLVVSLTAGPEEEARVSVGYDLERVDGENIDDEFCVICLGEILGGCGVIARLPCLHFYHEECIVSWFEKSNLCPLCRFEMPLECE